jgi:hypothetical protein
MLALVSEGADSQSKLKLSVACSGAGRSERAPLCLHDGPPCILLMFRMWIMYVLHVRLWFLNCGACFLCAVEFDIPFNFVVDVL